MGFGPHVGSREGSWCTQPSLWPAVCPTDWPEMSAIIASHGKDSKGLILNGPLTF